MKETLTDQLLRLLEKIKRASKRGGLPSIRMFKKTIDIAVIVSAKQDGLIRYDRRRNGTRVYLTNKGKDILADISNLSIPLNA